MKKLKNYKRSTLIIAASITCAIAIGYLLTDNPDEQYLTESTGEETAASTSQSFTENTINSETDNNSTIKETTSNEKKQIEMVRIKKNAEDNAEKDRINILEALGDTEADNRWSEAVSYIQDSYPDYFSNDSLLKKSIEYGHYLVSVYKDFEGADNGGGRYFEMGKIVSEAAQNIYTGVSLSTEDSIAGKMQELENLLQMTYGQYYGGYKGDTSHPAEKILISNHPVLDKTPYFAVSLGDVLSSSYQEFFSPETEDGYLHFFEEAGIIYAIGESNKETEDSSKKLKGVVLTDPKYEFGCGLKVGLTVQELMDMDILFNDSSLESIPNYMFLPFLKEKFDCDSVYIATEELSYDVNYSYINYRFLAFVQDDKVIAVSVDDAVGDLDEYNWELSSQNVETSANNANRDTVK